MTTGVRGRAVALLAGILLSSALVAGCGDAGDVDEPANAGESAPAAGASSGSTSSTATDPAADPAAEVWDFYDVGGHKLYMSCAGTGSPTVVYLHGWVDHSYIPHLNALKIRDLLSDDYRVCLYDRRNVGSSETVDAVQTPADMLSDMENVLRAGGAEPPYILMAASFGGLPAYSFLNHHPDEVAGMVFIDAMFPDELALDQYLPPQYTFRHYAQKDACCSPERISQFDLVRGLQRYIDHEPDVPLVYLASRQEPRNENDYGAPEYDARVLDYLAAFVNRFAPGKLLWVDAPHFMEAAVPGQIARAVREVDHLADAS